jgi:uncharacterized protein YbjT (DUF2867 family)
MPAGHRTALILGATGAVGRHCLDELLADKLYTRVVAMLRHPSGRTSPKLTEIVTPLERLGTLEPVQIGTIDDVFCCLGTTQKTAGTQAEFRRIECEFPRAAAKLAKACGARQMLIVTAIGADANSLFFYNKVKGEVEASVIAEGLQSTSIFRPSLLLAERAQFRWKEKLSEPFMRALGMIMVGPARSLRPIEAVTVARAMVRTAADPKPGVTIYPSDQIAAMGKV